MGNPTLRNTGYIFSNIFFLLFYFTKSDIKTTLIPITVFAAAVTPVENVSKLPHVIFWIWLHLLQFDVSNQTLHEDEDAFNKGDRPIPSGRITLHHARLFRWVLVPLCFAWSISYSYMALSASVSLVLLTILYNEFQAHAGHWLTRNLVNAAGFMSFELGATLIAGGDFNTISSTAKLAIMLSGGIFATTIHAQDFKDMEGDRRIGRCTIPLIMPALSRFTVLVPLVLWSVALAKVWELERDVTVAFVSLAFLVGGRFLLLRSRSSDQVSFYIYNVWLSIAHSLPAFQRYRLPGTM